MKWAAFIGVVFTTLPLCAEPTENFNLHINDLIKIHRQIYTTPYNSDIDKYGVDDKWVVDLYGDCEDKALWARQELLRLGADPKSMQLATVIILRDFERDVGILWEDGSVSWRGAWRTPHAVLVVKYENKLLVLDSAEAVLFEYNPYKYREIRYVTNENNDSGRGVGER